MSQAQGQTGPGKGKAFFDRAAQVAETGNWEFAIELYLEGIQREPDNIERGHQPLREVALKRKAQGGKASGFMESLKRKGGRDPLTGLINAERLLAKDPGSTNAMVGVLEASKKLNLPTITKWICDIILDAQRLAKKPNLGVQKLLIASYNGLEEFSSAIRACQMAIQLRPDDLLLAEDLRELMTKETIKKGKYDQEGDFTKGVKDMKGQMELAQRDSMVQGRDFLVQQIDKAREGYLASPTVPGKINSFVDALLKLEEEAYENEAIDVLVKANKDTGAYQFKMRVGDIKIRQMTRRYRKLLAEGDKPAAAEHARNQLEFELGEYAERAANYPTDLVVKYELGHRLFLAGRLDEAIAALQQAQRDPRRHVRALNLLGLAFQKKKWYHEAAETFEKAIQAELVEDQAKEIRYNLGDAYEQMGQFEKAQEQFSHVAQLDYNFKDVRARLESARKKLSGPSS